MLVKENNYRKLFPHFWNLDQNYHVYQDNYYNRVTVAETLLSRQVRVCGTIRVNRGLPPEMKNESQSLKRGETRFRRKDEILLQSWRDTRVVNMISTIHDSTMVDVPRRNEEVKKKPICIFQYNMFMKGVDRADQYLSYYSLFRKTVKWPKKVALWLINCALFNSFRIYQKLNPTSKMTYKEFLLQVAKTGLQIRWRQTQTQKQHAQEHQPKPLVCLMRTPLGDFRVICANMC